MFQKVKSFDIDIIVNHKNALFSKTVNIGVSDIGFKFLPFIDDKILEISMSHEIFIDFVYVFADFFDLGIILFLFFRNSQYRIRKQLHFVPCYKLQIFLNIVLEFAESAHDENALLFRQFAAQNRCKHVYSLLRKGVRQFSNTTFLP